MDISKEEFIRLIKSMPDSTKFKLKDRWIKVGNDEVQFAVFETTYKLGSVAYHSFE